jgi:hypothetical protein
MKTTRQNRPLLAALALAFVSLWAAPASAQFNLLRYDSSFFSYWYPAPTQPLYIDLVGHGLNGRSFNGKLLDGRMVSSVSLDDVVLQNGKVHDLELVDTQFGLAQGDSQKGCKGKDKDNDKDNDKGKGKGKGKGKDKLSQNKLIAAPGLIFTATLDDGDQVLLRVESVAAADASSPSYLRYVVSYAGENGWQPLCQSGDDGQPGFAIPLNGQWDYREGVEGGGDFLANSQTFTFACEGHVLAKCVDMGYAPWADGKLCDSNGKHCVAANLAPWHQACTRAMRADYCGDGRSWTLDGTLVAVRDGIGIRSDTDSWGLEAEWDQNGARCAMRDRIPLGVEPPCLSELEKLSCGEPKSFSDGALLITEVPL